MKLNMGLFAAAMAISLSGCDALNSATATSDAISKHDARILALEGEIKELKDAVALTEAKQHNLELRNTIQGWEKIAYLRPGDAGYQPIRYDLGILTIELADVKPYANGAKINLRFGNPLATSIQGLKAKIEWGPVDDKGNPINDPAKSKDVTFSEVLRSGAWTSVSVVLDGVPPEKLGFVRVKDVAHTGIQLNR